MNVSQLQVGPFQGISSGSIDSPVYMYSGQGVVYARVPRAPRAEVTCAWPPPTAASVALAMSFLNFSFAFFFWFLFIAFHASDCIRGARTQQREW